MKSVCLWEQVGVRFIVQHVANSNPFTGLDNTDSSRRLMLPEFLDNQH